MKTQCLLSTSMNCNDSQEKSDSVGKASMYMQKIYLKPHKKDIVLVIFLQYFLFFKGAVWTYNATSILLKLYENKLEMLETPKKKTRIWNAISENLKDYNIEVLNLKHFKKIVF